MWRMILAGDAGIFITFPNPVFFDIIPGEPGENSRFWFSGCFGILAVLVVINEWRSGTATYCLILEKEL